MAKDYQRPREGYTLAANGMKTNSAPETIPPDKLVLGVNIRGYRDTQTRTRPGVAARFATNFIPPFGGVPAVTDLATYTALGTDNLPRIIARLADDTLWLDTGVQVATLTGAGAGPGATLIPFRPNQSPNPYLYVANGSDYLKLSAPDAANAVTVSRVGIAEPQTSPDAAILSLTKFGLPSVAGSYVNAGTVGALSNSTRLSDTVQSVFLDPASTNGQIYTVGVSTSKLYARELPIALNGNAAPTVLDVFPAQANAVTIAAILYFTGNTGRCVVVPSNLSGGPGTEDASIYQQNLLGSIRRGALVRFSGSSETCFVLSVSVGPGGAISFETTTTGTHAAGETLTFPAAISIYLNGAPVPVAAQTITTPDITATATGSGIGKVTTTGGIGAPFVVGGVFFQPDDFIRVSLNIGTLTSLIEIKVLIDVDDGSFTKNFYYYTIRASDVTAAVQNTLTQLGAAQLVAQRRIIDEERATATGNQLDTASSAQTSPGDGQWADVMFSIRELTRVGSDETKTLQTAAQLQFLFNTTATTTIAIGAPAVLGGWQPDVGSAGSPYKYRVRPRSSHTGTKGNPSPATRYGLSPRRMQTIVKLPSAAYDPQIDTWDIFRYGGTVTSWRKIGQALATATTFIDNYSDQVAAASEALDFDNYEPWPTIDVPYLLTSATVVGTAALVPETSAAQTASILRLLPANLVRIGGVNVYTLRRRPTEVVVGGINTLLLDFEENAGTGGGANSTLQIYEPAIARQSLPYMWGPDSYGTVFACGDLLRPGTISFAKPNAPDAAPDKFNLEIVQPGEPLLGGEVLDGLSYAASTERWWALYPQLSNPVQRYAPIQQPVPRGLAAPYGHCTDGREIFFWAKDGIWSHRQGSLTDADLYNLFPHEGVPGETITLFGYTLTPPDYSRAGTFRLAQSNGFLYALYQDAGGVSRTLVYDQRRKAWGVDNYRVTVFAFGHATITNGAVTALYHIPQQEGTVLSHGTANPMMLFGNLLGQVGAQADLTNDWGTPIQSFVNTFEWDGGDLRFGGSLWGDVVLDASMPAATGITVTPTQQQVALLPPVTLPQRPARDQNILSVGGGLVSNFFGLALTWTDDFAAQTAPTELHLWQPSFLDKPETIADRFTDWDDAGTPGNKWWQGFVLHADTEGADKLLAVRDADMRALHPFTPVVNHLGESSRAYSFNTPFLAHTVRIEPQDQVPWRFYESVWVTEPSPELAETWQTQGTSHGMLGYQHVKQVSVAYAATTPITLAITSYDGQSPQPIVLPATGGAMQKLTMQLTPNKGQLYFYKASAAAPFQLFLPDWEIMVGAWSRADAAYTRYQALGGAKGDQAKI